MYKHPFLPGSNSTIRDCKIFIHKDASKKKFAKKSYFGDPLANGCDDFFFIENCPAASLS